MIIVKLLGGLRKAVGMPSFILHEPCVSISEILMVLGRHVKEPSMLSPKNILVAVNGVESSTLEGNDTLVESGDTVTIVTVVHGGSPKSGEEEAIAFCSLFHAIRRVGDPLTYRT